MRKNGAIKLLVDNNIRLFYIALFKVIALNLVIVFAIVERVIIKKRALKNINQRVISFAILKLKDFLLTKNIYFLGCTFIIFANPSSATN